MTAANVEDVRVGAAILGGGETKGDLRAEGGAQHKALIEVGGKTMLRWTIEVAHQAQTVSTIVVVRAPGSPLTEEHTLGERIVEAAVDSPTDSIVAGFQALQDCDRVLLWAADSPLVRAPEVDDFVRRSLATGADCCYPVIRKAVVVRAYPSAQRTFVKLKDGWYTSGNLALFASDFMATREPHIRRAFDARKSPVRMSMMFGPLLAFKFLTGFCSIDDLCRRAEHMLKCKFAVIELTDAALGMDVDKASDLRTVRALMR